MNPVSAHTISYAVFTNTLEKEFVWRSSTFGETGNYKKYIVWIVE